MLPVMKNTFLFLKRLKREKVSNTISVFIYLFQDTEGQTECHWALLIINISLIRKEMLEKEKGRGETKEGARQEKILQSISKKECSITLEWAGGLLGQCQVLLVQVVHGLVLVDLHAGAHITVSMQEERERARQVFSEKERHRCLS